MTFQAAQATPYGALTARLAADRLRSEIGGPPPDAALILGSGLGGLADQIEESVRIPFSAIPGFPQATVAGHAGALVAGRLDGRRVVALAGRFHLYEGHPPQLAAYPVRIVHALGAPLLVVSNAAGGLRRSFRPGDLMLISDHIDLMWRNPLTGPAEPGDERSPDMSDAYDAALRQLVRRQALELGVALHEGVYLGLLGPSYETPAEVRMLERLGADAVGMSTIPEVTVARALGMRVVGISCITNMACGLTMSPPSHDEVLAVAAAVGERFARLVRGVLSAASAATQTK